MSEARSEHGWIGALRGRRYLVMRVGPYWCLYEHLGALGWTMIDDSDLAAEIARLRGLVPPGGEEEKG